MTDAAPDAGGRWLRTLSVSLLAVLFVAACLFWIVYFPFQPSSVLRVIPSDASAVSFHWHPVKRVDALMKSLPVAMAWAAVGGEAQQIDAVMADPGVRSLLTRLGSTAVCTAWVPSFDAQYGPGLVMGAWVGGPTTQLMRNGWLDRSFIGFEVYRLERERVWSGYFPDLPPGLQYISFGVYEGVLAGCASSDPVGAARLLFLLKRHGEIALLARPWLDPAYDQSLSGWPTDRFRFRAVVDGGDVLGEGTFNVSVGNAQDAWLRLDERTEGGLSPLLFATSSESTGQVHHLPPCPLDLSVTAVQSGMPMERWRRLLAGVPLDARAQVAVARFAGLASPGAAAYGWASGGDFSGRIRRMKVPAVGLSMQVDSAMHTEMAAAVIVDTMNSLYGAGVIAVPDRKTHSIYTIHPVNDKGGLALLNADERPALVVRDGWLIVMSNVDVLRRCMDRPSANEPSPAGDWFIAKADLPALADVISNALAGYALVQLLQAGPSGRLDNPALRGVLEVMRTGGMVGIRAGNEGAARLNVNASIDQGVDHE